MSDVKTYINQRYPRYLDYAVYHCTCAGIGDEASDVLNEVLCNLWSKPIKKLQSLYEKKSAKCEYTELDFFILRMIKLNATSDTAPYRAKYKPIPRNENVDYSHLDIEDVSDDERDYPAETLEQMNKVRKILEELWLSEYAKSVFSWRFFCGEKFADWEGPENEKELFDVYYEVVELIKERLSGKQLTLF